MAFVPHTMDVVDISIVTQHQFLDRAKEFQWKQVLQLLSEAPSLINAQPCGRDGTKRWSALHQAAYGGHASVVSWLLAHGAALGATSSDGQTSLDVAEREDIRTILRTAERANLVPTPLRARAATRAPPVKNTFIHFDDTLLPQLELTRSYSSPVRPTLVAEDICVDVDSAVVASLPPSMSADQEMPCNTATSMVEADVEWQVGVDMTNENRDSVQVFPQESVPSTDQLIEPITLSLNEARPRRLRLSDHLPSGATVSTANRLFSPMVVSVTVFTVFDQSPLTASPVTSTQLAFFPVGHTSQGHFY